MSQTEHEQAGGGPTCDGQPGDGQPGDGQNGHERTGHGPTCEREAADESAADERPGDQHAVDAQPGPAPGAGHRSGPPELITDGVVELRKRGKLTAGRGGIGAEARLEAMARRAAERVAAECGRCA
uniref:Uncharacterized protein n=1 Tax=Streptomyces sp. NBC_00049 TaxID=2903617 RepID=A0AAU2JX91_9ACTN